MSVYILLISITCLILGILRMIFLLKRIGMNDLESFEECKKMAIEAWNRRSEE